MGGEGKLSRSGTLGSMSEEDREAYEREKEDLKRR